MASVEWSEESLLDLSDHDAWRVRQGWEPIALEIYDEVDAFFGGKDPGNPPRFLPGREAARNGEPVGERIVLIPVRSKQFRVFFHYRDGVFYITGVLHPRAN